MAEAARGGNIEHGSAVLDMSPMAHPLSLVDPPYEIEHDSSCAGGSQNRDAEYVGDSAESTASHDCIRPSSNHRISFTVGPPSASSPPPSLSGDRAGITCPSHDRCLSSLSPERSSERCLSPLTPEESADHCIPSLPPGDSAGTNSLPPGRRGHQLLSGDRTDYRSPPPERCTPPLIPGDCARDMGPPSDHRSSPPRHYQQVFRDNCDRCHSPASSASRP